MEIKIGKKTYKSGTITFKTFEKGTYLAQRLEEGDLIKDGFLTAEAFDFTKEIIVLYFNNQFSEDDIEHGLVIEDGLGYLEIIYRIINNIQTNEGRRQQLEEAVEEGKTKK